MYLIEISTGAGTRAPLCWQELTALGLAAVCPAELRGSPRPLALANEADAMFFLDLLRGLEVVETPVLVHLEAAELAPYLAETLEMNFVARDFAGAL